MRIGIDCRLWNESGVGRYTRNLIQELKALDKENEYVLFILSKNRDEILRLAQNDKSKLIESDIHWHSLEEQVKFPSILNKEKLDLMHFPYFSVPIFYNKPFVVTIHDLIIDHFPTGKASTHLKPIYDLKRFVYKKVLRHAVRNSKAIISPSNTTKDEIVQHFHVQQDKIIVTHEGIDQKILNSKSEIISKDLSSKFQKENFFLYVGNAYPHKNLDGLIEAFQKFKGEPNTENLELVLVGKEDYFYNRLKEKVRKLDLKSSIIFYGEAKDEELKWFYENSLALIVPSLMEGFGLPALEAMANNCLVIASDIPSLKEVSGDAAIYFDPFDVNDISKKMEMVFSKKDFTKNKEEGLERLKLFSWEKLAKETLEVYKKAGK